MEQSGVPLGLTLIKKFPILEGCPRGTECTVCEQDGVKCSPRGVVYMSECKPCKKNKGICSPKDKPMDIYVGETARPLRERALEHERNKRNWNTQSYQIAHWMEHHYNDPDCPEFNFRVVSRYNDPLRRQLSEALHILNSGTLNKKMEFNSNEICRLSPSQNAWEKEEEVNMDARERSTFKKKIGAFISIKSGVGGTRNKCDSVVECNPTVQHVTKCKPNSRYPKDLPKPQPRKRRRIGMECSTPITTARSRKEIDSPPDSPIDGQSEGSMSLVAESVSGPSALIPTGLSDNTTHLELTPKQHETSSKENRDLYTTTGCWSDAARHVGIIMKARSLPNVSLSLDGNALFRPIGCALNKSVDILFMDSVVNPWNQKELEQVKQSLTEGNVINEREKISKFQISPIRTNFLDEEQLNLPATPGGTGTKRLLRISPSTPTAGNLKVVIVDEASPELKSAPNRSRCYSLTNVEKQIRKLH